ncbi:MAG: hypothetical protein P9M14_02370, partial [Candidatus Alcyoniella australis]|nr:hypothetical protein [Candidatus Alcyoniella australis]
MIRWRGFSLLTLAALLLLTVPALAADYEIWPGDAWPVDKPLPEQNYIYHFMDNEGFSQSWFILVDLDDGGLITASVLTSNIGFGDNNCGVELNWIEPNGRSHFVRGDIDSDLLDASHDSFDIRIGQSYLKGKYPDFKFVVAEKNMRAEISFKIELTPWRPNGGRCYFSTDREDYYYFTVPMPMARATGTITLEGKRTTINGRGYMDYSFGTLLPYKYADRWQALRSL